MKLLSKSVICYFQYLKSILMMIHLKNKSTPWFLLIWSICYNETILFQLVVVKRHAVIKTSYCFNWLPWTSTRSSHWEVFLEINLNQKTLKFYTSWVHWKNQCRSTVRKHALLWNKHEYQHSADIFVKNIFNPFPGTGLFLYFLKYIKMFFRGHWKRAVP